MGHKQQTKCYRTQIECFAYVSQEKKGKSEIEIYINNKILNQFNKSKYLGIIFDSKLTLRGHNNNIEKSFQY